MASWAFKLACACRINSPSYAPDVPYGFFWQRVLSQCNIFQIQAWAWTSPWFYFIHTCTWSCTMKMIWYCPNITGNSRNSREYLKANLMSQRNALKCIQNYTDCLYQDHSMERQFHIKIRPNQDRMTPSNFCKILTPALTLISSWFHAVFWGRSPQESGL